MTNAAFMDPHSVHAAASHAGHAIVPTIEPVISESFMDIMGGVKNE